DRGGDAPPDDRMADAGPPQDLRHLGDMSEHVGERADGDRRAVRRRGAPADLEVADHRLAGHEELAHQDLPRSDREATFGDQPLDPWTGLRPDLEVVVDGRDLAVERERETRVRL